MEPTLQAPPVDEKTPERDLVPFLAGDAPNPSEVDWAEANLSHLPTELAWSTYRRVEETVVDGKTYRRAGHIIASPGTKNRFRIWLFDGVTEQDISLLETVVAKAKAGYFLSHGWKEMTANDGATVYIYELWMHERKRRPTGPGDTVHPCRVEACSATRHEDEFRRHVAEEIDGPVWNLSVEWLEDHAPDRWTVSLDVRGELDPEMASRLAGDLQWAAASARKLNAARPVDALSPQEVPC